MKECTVYHTGVWSRTNGFIKNNLVYISREYQSLSIDEKVGELCPPEGMFLAQEECECNLAQLKVNEKWGFVDIYTGEIKIAPVWDYAGPFYQGYAHVALGAKIEYYGNQVEPYGGKNGYIDRFGQVIIPLDYYDAHDISVAPIHQRATYFIVANKDMKWGMIDKQNRLIIPMKWSHIINSYRGLFFCDIYSYVKSKWCVYDINGNMIIEPKFDCQPDGSYSSSYYLVQKNGRYGVLGKDGTLFEDTNLSKEDAKALIRGLEEKSELTFCDEEE